MQSYILLQPRNYHWTSLSSMNGKLSIIWYYSFIKSTTKNAYALHQTYVTRLLSVNISGLSISVVRSLEGYIRGPGLKSQLLLDFSQHVFFILAKFIFWIMRNNLRRFVIVFPIRPCIKLICRSLAWNIVIKCLDNKISTKDLNCIWKIVD